jgi:hypothetical protein
MPKVTSDAASGTLPGCAVVTRLLGASPAGTAAFMTSWLLIEQPGPWPVDALEQVLAEAFPPGRLDALRANGLRPLLIRGPGRHQRASDAPRTVFVGGGVPGNRWLERLEINDLAELAGLDLDTLAEGRGGFGEPVSGPLFLVCTHGTKDMCCALLGRPLAIALGESHPGRTWEVSHVGGDRWAGNLLVVPDGYLHGQLDLDEAALVAEAALHGQVQPDRLRGRTSAETPWAQYAEIAVRKHTGLHGLDDAITIDEQPMPVPDGEARMVTVRAGRELYEVIVRRNLPKGSGSSRCSGRIAPAGYITEDVRTMTRETSMHA